MQSTCRPRTSIFGILNAMRSFVLLSVAALLCPALCPAQEIAGRLDEIVRSFSDQNRFMGTALVAKGDQVLLSKGYGFANLEWKIPNVPNAKFRLGSITKQFTAACILLLEERGKLSVDDPLSKHMSDAPEAWKDITIRHVLSHTSGIPSFTGFPNYRELEKNEYTAEKLVALFRDKPLDFQPGEKWNYSNSGFVLLGYLVEKISGQSYADFVKQNIFDKLGMKDSGYDLNRTVIEHRASGYTPSPKGIENAGYINMTVPHGAGALYSTTEDLLRWETGLFGGKVLKPESLVKMTTPVKNDYAFGLGVEEKNGRKMISHGGGIEGFNTQLNYYPAEKVTVAVLGNLNGGAPGEIAAMLGKVALGETVLLPTERKEVKLSPEALAPLAGEYVLNPKASLTTTVENGQLMGQMTGQGKIPLFAESENKFFLKVVNAQLEFHREADGKVTGVTLFQNGHETKANRK